jgi:ribonucleoside-diphosphate reductase alpha chain
MYREQGGDVAHLPRGFVTALEISALDHMAMVAAVGSAIDSSISKTVNVPEDYPYVEFENLYHAAWKAGLGVCALAAGIAGMARARAATRNVARLFMV